MSDTQIKRSAVALSENVPAGWRRFTDALAAAGAEVFARENAGRDTAQQAEIAESMGLSAMQVSRLLRRTLDELRRQLSAEGVASA